ncbi:helix-turn-helix transcriptional regulator [Nocardioides halotolerans]|uniref:helix-turn-helix transcriptional regulator n=1 Tax=Nocardioides halotolerans TaxID=433660 RepID=UPI00146A3976|nr:helix-turn-helix transcriptional regulator [Nocardioides halotolerans]
MAVHTTSRTLIGRDAELTEIASLLGVSSSADDAERTVPPRHVVLSGDAGVGKTRLLVELRDLAVEEGWRVFAGHCLDFGDSALPYLPFSEVLGRLQAELPEVVARVAEAHPALARLQPGRRVLVPAEGTPGRIEGESVDRADLFAAVHTLLGEAAAEAPLLLVIEDCHWADQSTRDLLSFLFSRPFEGAGEGRVAIVASYRSDDLHRRHPLRRQVAEWSRLGGVERLQLAPLGDEHVRLLIASLSPDSMREKELSAIVRRAEGNAFFVEELVGAATQPGSWVPDELADVLLVRLDRLNEAARQVVRVASVAGRKVAHDLLVAASGVPVDSLEEGLRQAVEMNLLVPGEGTYSFRHALLGEAVYDDLLPGERVRLHAQYAEALKEGMGRGTAAELARHARLAHDLETALDASIRAGDEATAVAGPDEAAHHYEQALELLADPRRRSTCQIDISKLSVSAAEALTASGQPTRAAALLAEQLAALAPDAPPGWRARMLAAQADVVILTESPDLDPCELVQQAVDLLPEDAGGLRAKVLAIQARVLTGYGRYDEAQAAGLDALALAERLDLHELAADVITTLSQLKKAGPKDALRSALVEAVHRAVETGALRAELRARYFLGRSYQDWAEWAQAETWFRSAMKSAADAGVPYGPWGWESRWQLAWIKSVDGDWDEALRLADTSNEQVPPIPAALVAGVALLVESGRGEPVAERARALRRFWELEGGVAINSVVAEMADAARADDPIKVIGVYDDAVTVLGRIWHPWFSARIRLAAIATGAVADALPRLSGAERTELMAEVERLHGDGHVVLQKYTDPSGHWGPEGRAWVKRLDAETLRARWLSGVDAPTQDDLVQVWREAADLYEEFGHVHELATVRAVLAGILRSTGDTAGARELADQAREVAHRLGAVPLLDRLRAQGSAPARADGSASDTLTARESEILALVAEGRSNGEIGKQLFISAKTVSVHVSNILAKLNASGRTEAAAIARRRGLIPG